MTVVHPDAAVHRAALVDFAYWAINQLQAAATDERPKDAEILSVIGFHIANARQLLDMLTTPVPAPEVEGDTGVTTNPGA